MRKPLVNLLFVLIVSVLGNGCAKSDMGAKGTAIIVTPSSITAKPGDSLSFKILVADSTSISDFYATMETHNVSLKYFDKYIGEKKFNFTFGFTIPPGFIGQLTLFITANGSEGETKAQATINVPGPPEPSLNVYDSIVLGNYANANIGSFLSTALSVVYNETDAKLHSSDIDFGFLIGVHTLATLAAPADNSYGLHADQVDLGVVHWQTRHTTRFFSTYANDFDIIKTAVDLESAYGNERFAIDKPLSTTFLEKNMIIGFITDGGKIGLVKILSISPGANSSGIGTMSIKMKVQK